MGYVFALLVIALVGKDVLPFGDSYVLRGISEGPALMVGLYWLMTWGSADLPKRYALVFAYLALLLLTSVVSRRPLYVVVQTSSLIATILFFIAYIETQRKEIHKNKAALMMTALVFTAVCLASLILAYDRPQWVYESTREGYRFNGLFGKAAMMGAASGILFGLSVLGRWNWPLRIAGLFVSLPCLYLTGSRTFWVAAVVALCVTAAFYFKHKRTWTTATIIFAAILPLMMAAADLRISSKEESQILREKSITNLSGRVTIWNVALAKFWNRPFLGYGFTIGADAFDNEAQGLKVMKAPGTDAQHQRSFTPTLHDGFIQALLDSGALGAFLYVAIIGYALWALFKRDTARQYGAELYVLIFMSLSNVGETVIFSAAMYSGVLYWYIAIFAMSLRQTEKGATALPRAGSGARPAAAGFDRLRFPRVRRQTHSLPV
ncbi:MAG TPA: O-antigen ligase family protein [Nitrospiria bacterium]|nr:O-antigen ligase family protein [Nitrospiria bacterium]